MKPILNPKYQRTAATRSQQVVDAIIKKKPMDYKNLTYGCCPLCLDLVTMQEYQEGTLVGCPVCRFRMDAQKFYARCKPKTFWYYQVKSRSRGEEEVMNDICQLQ